MKVLDNVVRYFLGAFFIVSGLLKINDPKGTAIKLEEYFEVFAADFGAFFEIFIPVSLPLAVFVIVLEIILGVALIIGHKMKITAWSFLLLIIFFTALTFYSAVTGKVTDCGCFGDVVKLTPWESFYKDVVLLAFTIYIFIRKDKIESWFTSRTGHLVMGAATAINLFIAIYAIRHLPYIDFRPYHVGAHIPTYMKPSEELRFMYVMERDGEEFEFETYPSDTTYVFKNIVPLNPEAQPRITDYSVWNDEGDFTEFTFEGVKALVVIADVRNSDARGIEKIKELSAVATGVEFIALTATDEPTFERYRHEYQLALPYYFADGTVLKTMIRSNPGLMLLRDGTVLGKWHHNDIPSAEELQELTESS